MIRISVGILLWVVKLFFIPLCLQLSCQKFVLQGFQCFHRGNFHKRGPFMQQGIMSMNIGDTSNQYEQDTYMSNEVSQPKETIKKVEFNRHGEAVGPNATHFKSQVGKYVKTFIPISYTDWKKKEFEAQGYLRKSIEKSMPDTFRKLKHSLRKNHFDKHLTLEEKKLDIPDGIRKEDWEQFCCNESNERQIEIRAKAVESRKRSLYGHTGGRKSATMIEHDMIAKSGDHFISRSEVWLEAHKRKDGSILLGAEPFAECS